LRRLALWIALSAAVSGGIWYAAHAYRSIGTPDPAEIPTARVLRGDVSLSVTARGELRGGNSEVLNAPMIGGAEMHIIYLKTPGDMVKAGDIVVGLDTTEQEYRLTEAQADLDEARERIVQAKAQKQANEEEDRYALLKAEADVKVAELDVRRNPLLPAITAHENDLDLANARDKLKQLQQNIANRKATNDASIEIQEAAAAKAEAQATTARRNIEAMTLRADRDGYVSIRQNTTGNMIFYGMTLPLYQSGDAVRPGMAIAEIPDLKTWEIAADASELDRGHLAPGDPVDITIIAVPNRPFHGRVKLLGGTTGPPWNRHFECKISLDDPVAALRPGMNAQVVITTDRLRGVLSLPAQALFESGGRTFVYARASSGFTPVDVQLVRRNETRVVITGINEGQEVALANPTELANKKAGPSGAMKSLSQ
jgi:HlyD family secretion protein